LARGCASTVLEFIRKTYWFKNNRSPRPIVMLSPWSTVPLPNVGTITGRGTSPLYPSVLQPSISQVVDCYHLAFTCWSYCSRQKTRAVLKYTLQSPKHLKANHSLVRLILIINCYIIVY
jgi:hypothetical protein